MKRVWWCVAARLKVLMLYADEVVRGIDRSRELVHLALHAAYRGDRRLFFLAMKGVRNLLGCNAGSLSALALSYYELGCKAYASQLLGWALSTFPDDVDVLMVYGTYLEREAKPLDALPYVQRAAKERPTDSTALGWLGDVYYALGRLEEAERCYRRSIEADRQQSGYQWSRLAHLAAQRGDWDEATRLWRKAARVRPTDEEVRYNLGNALCEIGQFRPAKKAFERAIRLGLAKPEMALYGIALCSAELGQHMRAAKYCRMALRHNPAYAPALALEAKMRSSKGVVHGKS